MKKCLQGQVQIMKIYLSNKECWIYGRLNKFEKRELMSFSRVSKYNSKLIISKIFPSIHLAYTYNAI